MKIYLAAPLFTLCERSFNAELDIALSPYGYDCALPQNFCKGIIASRIKAARCLRELRGSHIVVMNCDGADVESGTAFEAGYAHARQIPIIGYRTDSRKGGDNTIWPINLMMGSYLDSFIEESIFHKLETALRLALVRIEVKLLGSRARSIIETWPKWKQDFAEQWLLQRYNYDD